MKVGPRVFAGLESARDSEMAVQERAEPVGKAGVVAGEVAATEVMERMGSVEEKVGEAGGPGRLLAGSCLVRREVTVRVEAARAGAGPPTREAGEGAQSSGGAAESRLAGGSTARVEAAQSGATPPAMAAAGK